MLTFGISIPFSLRVTSVLRLAHNDEDVVVVVLARFEVTDGGFGVDDGHACSGRLAHAHRLFLDFIAGYDVVDDHQAFGFRHSCPLGSRRFRG